MEDSQTASVKETQSNSTNVSASPATTPPGFTDAVAIQLVKQIPAFQQDLRTPDPNKVIKVEGTS